MKIKNKYWLIASVLNVFTALVHTIDGQSTLVNPLQNSTLSLQIQTEWLGVWHMATAILWLTSYYGVSAVFTENKEVALFRFIGILYLLFGGAFLFASILNRIFAPQWILLLPIGIFFLLGVHHHKIKQ